MLPLPLQRRLTTESPPGEPYMGGVPMDEHQACPGMPVYAYFGTQKPSRAALSAFS